MKLDVKKHLIRNFPYLFAFWLCNRIGESFRLADGGDVIDQAMDAVVLVGGSHLPSPAPQPLPL